MKRRIVLIMAFLLLFLFFFGYSRFQQNRVKASVVYPVHNLDTGLNYTTIQEAINANETLDNQTILVDSGTYNESIRIDKSISLTGEKRDSTILNWTVETWDTPLINITANNVKLSGFSILGWVGTKVSVLSCSNVTIRDDIIWSAGMCIVLWSSKNCTISDNRIVGGGLEGNNLVVLSSSDGCLIENNLVEDACYEGIGLHSSSNNQILNNQLIGDGQAINLDSAWDNVVFNNSISSGGGDGIKLGGSGNIIFSNTVSGYWNGLEFEGTGNTIYGNNFEGNYYQLYGSFTGNSLNQSSLGNYYSDYKGLDMNQDGIGDIPYLAEYFPHSFANADYYPLVGKYQTFAVNSSQSESQFFTVISNSTISSFNLEYSVPSNDTIQHNQPFINFTVTGENGTTGSCRLTVPNSIMNSSSYIVFVDNKQVNVKMLPSSDSNHSILYFTYSHSTHQVLVLIPEFPLSPIPLFIIATLVAVLICRRKH